MVFTTPVSTGKPGYQTQPGEYVVTHKYPAWRSTLYNAPMPNFMRLSCGPTGMHGGVVPGVPASHGCIRSCPAENAAALYRVVQPGDRVSIKLSRRKSAFFPQANRYLISCDFRQL